MTILCTIISPPHSLGGSHCGNNSGDMVMIITVITVMTGDNGNSSYVGGGCNANLQQKHVLVQHGSDNGHIYVQCTPMYKICTWYLLNTILRQTQNKFCTTQQLGECHDKPAGLVCKIFRFQYMQGQRFFFLCSLQSGPWTIQSPFQWALRGSFPTNSIKPLTYL